MAKNNSDPDLKQHLAADLIRQKIAQLHAQEPPAKAEMVDAKSASRHSKHQQYMIDLSRSGRSLAEIQTAWHNYYANLSDKEKHEVWQEFYAQQGRHFGQQPQHHQAAKPTKSPTTRLLKAAPATLAELKQQVLKTVAGHSRLKPKHHLKSLIFGLSMGGLAMLILLFGFFNERFIAPFISPSKSVSSTPVIIDPGATDAAGTSPQIIIPKINVEVPVVYDTGSVEEKAIQSALEGGVVHYAATPKPGEQGNAVIVGHSSNNILNRGRYKFAFVLLNRLEAGDTFIIVKDGKRYVYKVFEKKVVGPTDFSVLGTTAKPSSVSLITCDPPGTAINRLVVVGEQIVPDPAANIASSAQPADAQPKILPSNAPSLWQRFKDWLFG